MKHVWLLALLTACPTTEAPSVRIVHDTVRVIQHDTVKLRFTIHDTLRLTVRDTVLVTVRDTFLILHVYDSAVVVRWDTLDVTAWGSTNSTCLQGYVPDADLIDSVAYRRHLRSEDSTSWLCPRGRWYQGGEWLTSKTGRICRYPLPKRGENPKRWYCGWVWK